MSGNNVPLDSSNYTLMSKIRTQVQDNSATRSLQTALESGDTGMRFLFLIALGLNVFFSGGSKYMFYLIRALQLVVHFPIMRIILPGNVSMLMSIIMPIVMFDILDNDLEIDAGMIYNFSEESQGDDILD